MLKTAQPHRRAATPQIRVRDTLPPAPAARPDPSDMEAAFAAWGGLAEVPSGLLRHLDLALALGPQGFNALVRDDTRALSALNLPREVLPAALSVAARMGRPAVAEWASEAIAAARAALVGGPAGTGRAVPALAPDRDQEHLVAALIGAIQRHNLRLATALVRGGADVNGAETDDNGYSVLATACATGSEPLVELLLNAGADPCRGHTSGLVFAAGCGDRRAILRMRQSVGSRGFDFESASQAHLKAASNGCLAVAALLWEDCEAAARREARNESERIERMSGLHTAGFVALCASADAASVAHQLPGVAQSPDVVVRGLATAIECGRWNVALAIVGAFRASFSSDLCSEALAAASRWRELTARDRDPALYAAGADAFQRVALACLEITLRDPSRFGRVAEVVERAQVACPAVAAWFERRALAASVLAGEREATPDESTARREREQPALTVAKPAGAMRL